MRWNKNRLAFVAGPCLFLVFIIMPWSAAPNAKMVAGITLWMAIWWITEPVALPVTSLLPMILFPLTGVLSLKSTTAEYANEIIYLFFSGFIFGKAIEFWGLHRRIALTMVYAIGNNPQRMLLGFMASSAFISMWISNTAAAAMMTPVAIALLVGRKSFEPNFAKSMMLGVGYACSIGGLATLVGTPTNAVFVSFVNTKMDGNVSFWKWFQMGFPFALLLLWVCWRMLLWMFPLEKKSDPMLESRQAIRKELDMLGATTTNEKRLIAIFLMLVLGWLTGSLFWYEWLGWKSSTGDTVLAVSMAFLLFIIPTSDHSQQHTLMNWELAERIPWGIIVFFGGGLAMAKGFDESGLAAWLGNQMEVLQHLPVVVMLTLTLLLVVALSEIASNIATASMMMPVLYSLAKAIDVHPFGFLVAAALASSIGFGLPVATAPNTIVFSSGFFTTRDMARAGFLLDVLAVVLLVLLVYVLMPLAWGVRM